MESITYADLAFSLEKAQVPGDIVKHLNYELFKSTAFLDEPKSIIEVIKSKSINFEEEKGYTNVILSNDSQNQLTGRSISMFNVFSVNSKEFYSKLGFSAFKIGASIFENKFDETIFSNIVILIELIKEFKKINLYYFTTHEAQVLYAICCLNKTEFTLTEIKNSFESIYKANADNNNILLILNKLIELNIITFAGSLYYLLEVIKLDNNSN